MPTITVSALQRLMESASYAEHSIGRNDEIQRSNCGFPRKSQLRTRTRPQSAPRAYSHDDYQRPGRGWTAHRSVFEPKFSRSRPQSAKSNLSYAGSCGESELDFTGLSNMMQGLRFKQSRNWKPRSNSDQNDNNISNKNENFKASCHKGKVTTIEAKESDPNTLRKSRTSSCSKFKYPLQHHNIKDPNARLILERSVPACLRKVSRYINAPMRKNCAYNPPVRAVTKVNMHSIKSSSLPSPRLGKHVTTKPPIAPKQRSSSVDLENHRHELRSTVEEDDRERNGSYHYVYTGPTEGNRDVIVETPQRMYTEEHISTSQYPDSTTEFVVNSQSQIDDSHHMVNQNDGIKFDKPTHVIKDKASGSDTDDLYSDDDDLAAQYDEVLRNTYDDQLSSVDEEFKNGAPEKGKSWKSLPNQSMDERYQHSSTEEIQSDIEEDIPEEIPAKTFNFTSNRAFKK